MDETEGLEKNPNLELVQIRFLLTLSNELVSEKEKKELTTKLMKEIEEHNMSTFYVESCSILKWKVDNSILSKMSSINKNKFIELTKAVKNAEENEGEIEVRDALHAIADHHTRIGSKSEAIEAFLKTMDKTVGAGPRLDIVFSLIRLGMFHSDPKMTKENIDYAKELIEDGGDWERRNRLKVYEATYYLSIRDFKKASNLFLESLATFTSYELYSYDHFVFYTVLISLFSLDRITLKSRVINSPEILSVVLSRPSLESILNSFYGCDYASFFASLTENSDQISRDYVLAPHARYYVREMRIAAYAQFLESYRSVTISSMAKSFGVTTTFLDAELSRFISVGRLNAKIDKVSGIIETTRPDLKNAQYQEMLKKGDALLNRVQKLSSVTNI